jgi:sulfate adenylyltransferase
VDPPAEERRLRRELQRAPRIQIDSSLRQDLWLLATGAYSPLTGFVDERNHTTVLREARLEDGTVWPIPIELTVEEDTARALGAGEQVGLWDADELLGALEVEAVFPHDAAECARHVYGTEDPTHPGVARLLGRGRFLVAGPVRVFRGWQPVEDGRFLFTPTETRALFERNRWRTVVGFQTRNPIHRAHEFIQKTALETVDGLLVHPLVGETKADDVPADVRLRTYQALLSAYYPPHRTLLAVLPVAMRYAGPREAVFHALLRKNFGCTHFIVGRDHAGVNGFYGTYEAQEIFSRFSGEELGIVPLKFEHTFFCRTCDGMASIKTCPHPDEHRVVMSGSRLREMLRNGEEPPKEIIRPEVSRILLASTNTAPSALERNLPHA